jgi:hypothetical protein
MNSVELGVASVKSVKFALISTEKIVLKTEDDKEIIFTPVQQADGTYLLVGKKKDV